jgi:2-oxoglutarate ferredoxin oxidoreductase subunit gamma
VGDEKMAKEIRISGTGGQGVILMGIILAEAAGIYEGKEVVQAQDYGGAVRGGAVRSEVIIADQGEVLPWVGVINSDILVAMSQPAADWWTPTVKHGGLILYDSTNVTKTPNSFAQVYNVPLTAIARESVGSDLGANMVALGVIQGLTQIVSADALRWAVRQRIPRGTEQFNDKALQSGFEAAESIRS